MKFLNFIKCNKLFSVLSICLINFFGLYFFELNNFSARYIVNYKSLGDIRKVINPHVENDALLNTYFYTNRSPDYFSNLLNEGLKHIKKGFDNSVLVTQHTNWIRVKTSSNKEQLAFSRIVEIEKKIKEAFEWEIKNDFANETQNNRQILNYLLIRNIDDIKTDLKKYFSIPKKYLNKEIDFKNLEEVVDFFTFNDLSLIIKSQIPNHNISNEEKLLFIQNIDTKFKEFFFEKYPLDFKEQTSHPKVFLFDNFFITEKKLIRNYNPYILILSIFLISLFLLYIIFFFKEIFLNVKKTYFNGKRTY